MPELPEVETWRRAIHGWMVGRRVTAIHVLEPTSVRATLSTRPSPPAPSLLRSIEAGAGSEVVGTGRHGKRMALQLGDAWWLVHLGMTGRFERSGSEAPPHARVGWELASGEVVWFRDARRFGGVVPLAARGELSEGLGPDALDALDGPRLAQRFSGRRAVKVALLDQGCLAGLGNIHAAEALWRAGIDPRRPVGEVSPDAWERLAEAIPAQLQDALAEMPSVEDFVYVTDGGENPFAVYGRADESCRRCDRSIQRVVQGGRSTFWCPGCQPASP